MISGRRAMDSRKLVFRETGIIAIGETIGLALMLAVCALLGWFNLQTVLGGVIGALMTIFNFFLMAIGTSLAADRAAQQNVKSGNALIKGSYMLRYAVIFVVLFACVKSGLCNAITCVLPLVFVQPIITVAEFFRKPGETKA